MQYPVECKLNVPKILKDEITIKINSGLTTFVGPNGSGKTQTLKAIRDKYRNNLLKGKVRYISSNRIGEMERYRSKTDYYGYDESSFYLAQSVLKKGKYEIETANADFIIMDEKKDIFIKIAERLSLFFNRKIYIRWENGNLNVYFQKESNETEYSIIHEASGIINLISILVAAYDDKIELLLIDEPEVSLHPQLQSYLLNEIKTAIKITGKTVIISTHSTEMINIENIDDLSNIVFFEEDKEPIQIEPSNPILKNNKLKAFINITMGHIHKKAFFAKKVFLVEGPSDEIICKFILNKFNINLGVAGAEIIVANGKSNFMQIVKFFDLIGKEIIILTDLDGFIDDNEIINLFNGSEKISNELIKNGSSNIVDLATNFKNDFNSLLNKDKVGLANIYIKHPYYSCATSKDDSAIKRAMLGSLMSENDSDITLWSNAKEWKNLKSRFKAILGYLKKRRMLYFRKGKYRKLLLLFS